MRRIEMGKLRTTAVTPCCDACVISSLTDAAFDYTEKYVIYSGLQSVAARSRRALVEALIDNAEGDVILVVSAPVPAEFREDGAAAPAAEENTDDGAAPSVDDLEAMFGSGAAGNEH
jgi:hypothetical protein